MIKIQTVQKHKDLGEEIYHYLGHICPGNEIGVDELANEFNVAKMTVRSVVKSLINQKRILSTKWLKNKIVYHRIPF